MFFTTEVFTMFI